MKLVFETMPPSTNHLYGRTRRGGVSLLDSVRQAKDDLGWEARDQFHGEPLTEALSVDVSLFWGDRRKHDIDNIKALLDALTGVVWEDDGQIIDLNIHKRFDKENPRVEMTVELA